MVSNKIALTVELKGYVGGAYPDAGKKSLYIFKL